ncbi:MAG: SLC13 family permease, partial [Candidatus Adiutrix sp.]
IKVNVILSLIVAALTGGVLAGMGMQEIMSGMISGMSSNGENTIGYLLLGAFAVSIAHTGVADMLVRKVSVMVKGKKLALLLTLMVCAAISGTLIPVHIAFIPILVPPLLWMMNEMKLDRRGAACALAFGLKAPYITLPIGYGLIFQSIIAKNMTENGMAIETMEVFKYNWILGLGMLFGLALSIWYYSKNRNYQDIAVEGADIKAETAFGRKHIVALVAIAVTLCVQLYYSSMPLGAIAGLAVMIIGGAVKLNENDEIMLGGIKLMGMIAFVMLIAGSYSSIIRSTGAVETLVNATVNILGDNKAIFIIVMILIGLLITMGIGTSFGTVPVIAVLYVPMSLEMGLSVGACCCLIACAAALGDAGSPASDTTLGPTAGLNADGQHNHIWDTCVPTFTFYNIPLAIFGFIGAMIL